MKCTAPIRSLLVLVSLAAPALAEGVFRDMSFDDALAEAGKAEKVVMVDFFTTWCGPCKKLDAVTWKDEGVVAWLSEHTIALKIDAEKEVELARRYKVRAYPSMVFIRPDGTELGRVLGYHGPKEFLTVGADTLAGVTRVDRLREELEEAGGEDTSLRHELGRELLREGKHAEALEQLLWCWDHGVEHQPGYTGVRTSYLMNDFRQLAKDYPPTSDALRTRRDACEKAVVELKADAALVRDMAALNEQLGEAERTLAAYERLIVPDEATEAVRDQREKLRRALFLHVLDALIEQRRYEEVANMIDDASAVIEARFATFEDAGEGEMLPLLRRRVIVEGGKYYEALLGVERHDEASALAARILEADSQYSTYKLLIAHAVRSGAAEVADGWLERARKELPEKYHRRLERTRERG